MTIFIKMVNKNNISLLLGDIFFACILKLSAEPKCSKNKKNVLRLNNEKKTLSAKLLLKRTI